MLKCRGVEYSCEEMVMIMSSWLGGWWVGKQTKWMAEGRTISCFHVILVIILRMNGADCCEKRDRS
jgi:hypothetical protein